MIRKQFPPSMVWGLQNAQYALSVKLQQTMHGRVVPWSRPYYRYKCEYVAKMLDDPQLLERFRRGIPLPTGYGIGIDERCVEYPWLITHLGNAERILDAGSTLNFEFLFEQPQLGEARIHVMTLAPEANCFWQRGIGYLFNDLRDIPIRDDYYDAVACVSTLEHVGFDNTLYTGRDADRESRPEDFLAVMRELRRVVRPGGALLLTVPFGVYMRFPTCQQFDERLLERAVEAFGPVDSPAYAFFRYDCSGWQLATSGDCAGCEYVGWVERIAATRVVPRPLPIEPDWAAAARAVACVRLVKGE